MIILTILSALLTILFLLQLITLTSINTLLKDTHNINNISIKLETLTRHLEKIENTTDNIKLNQHIHETYKEIFRRD